MSDAADDAKIDALVDQHVQALMEHFDCVQLFCSRYLGGGGDSTGKVSAGRGNYYARYGQVREWMVQEECRAAHEVIDDGPSGEPPDDDSDLEEDE